MNESQNKLLNDLITSLYKKLRKYSSIKIKIIILSQIQYLLDFAFDNDFDIKQIPIDQIYLDKTKIQCITSKENSAFKQNYKDMFETNYKISKMGETLAKKFGLYHLGISQKRLNLAEAKYLAELFFQHYDKDIYQFYKSLINGNNVFVIPLDNNYAGSNFSLPTEEISLMCFSDQNTIETALTIVHETIHAYIASFHYNLTLEQEIKKNINNLQEVYTETIELIFINFAINLNYNKKDIIKLIFSTNYTMIKELINYSGFLENFDPEDIICDESVYLEFLEYEAYSYGKVMSKHYYDLYLQDPEQTKKKFIKVIN